LDTDNTLYSNEQNTIVSAKHDSTPKFDSNQIESNTINYDCADKKAIIDEHSLSCSVSKLNKHESSILSILSQKSLFYQSLNKNKIDELKRALIEFRRKNYLKSQKNQKVLNRDLNKDIVTEEKAFELHSNEKLIGFKLNPNPQQNENDIGRSSKKKIRLHEDASKDQNSISFIINGKRYYRKLII
jgi:hypothetical protein